MYLTFACNLGHIQSNNQSAVLFVQMLAAKFPDPNLSAWHCRGLEAFARCIAAFPNMMSLILQKVCGLPCPFCSLAWRMSRVAVSL